MCNISTLCYNQNIKQLIRKEQQMERMSDKEIAEKVMEKFSKFVKGIHDEYGVGAGMFIISLEEDNVDTLIGSVFGNVRKWDDHWEERLKNCAVETIAGATRSAKESCEEHKKFDERTIKLAKKTWHSQKRQD